MSEHAGGMFIDQFKNWSILLSDFPVSRKGKSDASESLHLRHKRRCLKIVKETIERQRLFHLAKIVEKGGLFKP